MRDVHAEEEVAKQPQGRKDDKSISSTLAGMLAAGGTSASSMENFVVTAARSDRGV